MTLVFGLYLDTYEARTHRVVNIEAPPFQEGFWVLRRCGTSSRGNATADIDKTQWLKFHDASPSHLECSPGQVVIGLDHAP